MYTILTRNVKEYVNSFEFEYSLNLHTDEVKSRYCTKTQRISERRFPCLTGND